MAAARRDPVVLRRADRRPRRRPVPHRAAAGRRGDRALREPAGDPGGDPGARHRRPGRDPRRGRRRSRLRRDRRRERLQPGPRHDSSGPDARGRGHRQPRGRPGAQHLHPPRARPDPRLGAPLLRPLAARLRSFAVGQRRSEARRIRPRPAHSHGGGRRGRDDRHAHPGRPVRAAPRHARVLRGGNPDRRALDRRRSRSDRPSPRRRRGSAWRSRPRRPIRRSPHSAIRAPSCCSRPVSRGSCTT
jgi:hypothetical protein